jgi:hypothetical protein
MEGEPVAQTYIDDNTELMIAELHDTIDKQKATIAEVTDLCSKQKQIICELKSMNDMLILVMDYRRQLEQKLGITYSGMRIMNYPKD